MVNNVVSPDTTKEERLHHLPQLNPPPLPVRHLLHATQSAAAPAVVIEDVAAGESTKRGRTTTTTGRNEEDRDLGQDQETDNKVVKGVERLAAHEPKDKESSADYEERTKHERRRRRCPIVTIERFLNNGEDEEEGKEDAVTNRKQRCASPVLCEIVYSPLPALNSLCLQTLSTP